MNFLESVNRLRLRLRQEGLRRVVNLVYRIVYNYLAPPWYKVYWIPVGEVPEPGSDRNIPPGYESFWKLVVRLVQGVKLEVVHNLDELDPHQMQSLIECVGVSALPVFQERLSRGIELHILFLFAEARVVGTAFFVLGKRQPFQHLVLTDRDVMGLDAHIEPAFRGRGLFPIFLWLSILHLRKQGIERVFADLAEWNTESNRSLECLGFRYLLKYKLVRGSYRYDKVAL
jgi:hypothetical protein